MGNNNIKILGVFATVLLLVIVITASFAYFGSFNVNLNNNVAVNVNAYSPGDAVFTSNATQLNLQVPAANMSQTVANNSIAASNTANLTVNLTGAENLLTTCTYDIVYEYDDDSYIYGGSQTKSVAKNGDKEITLQVSGVNGTNNFASEKNFDYDSSWTNNKRTLVSGAVIVSDGTIATQNISITGKYYNLTISQSSLEGKAFTGKIYITNHSCETNEIPSVGYEKILALNGGIKYIESKGIPDFSKAINNGMYAAQDDLGTSYYFRGAVDNNWLQYGEYTKNMYNCNNGTFSETDTGDSCIKIASQGDKMYWRIIRINGDGSIRLIYNGITPPVESSKVFMTGDITLGKSAFNELKENREFAGYMYTLGEQHGNTTSSPIKESIDNWYANYTNLNASETKITDQIYCNDRTASTTDVAYSDTTYTTLTNWESGTKIYYGANGRIIKANNPILTCPVDADRFTVNKINGKGNSALTYPVGLMTADEAKMAGNNDDKFNNYLYSYEGYWLGSPTAFAMSRSWVFSSAYSNISYQQTIITYGILPVISLSSTVKLAGNGTYNNIYTVS